MNVANLITILRFPVLVGVVLLLYYGGMAGRLVAAGCIVLLILMDTLDGVVARRLHQETLLGSALDIAADRAVEIVLWVVYAHLGLIPTLIPIVVVMRGTLTDSIRNVAVQYGLSAHQMMRSRLGHWLVASPSMRTGYAVVKVAAFTLLAVTAGIERRPGWRGVWTAASVCSWAALLLCLARGLPVLIESPGLFRLLAVQQPPRSDRDLAGEARNRRMTS